MKKTKLVKLIAAALVCVMVPGSFVSFGKNASKPRFTENDLERINIQIKEGFEWLNFGEVEFAAPIEIPDVADEEITIPEVSSFADVDTSHWAYANIEEAKARHWVDGTGSGKFSPDGTVTYGQWVTMLCRVYFSEDAAKQPTGKYWYSPYYNVAMEKGLLLGTRFYNAPEYGSQGIPRYEMATIVYRLIKDCFGRIFDKDSELYGVSSFSDTYIDGVLRCADLGILSGTGNGKFSPNNTMTRAQAAAVLCRIPDALKKEGIFDVSMETLRNAHNAAENTLKSGKAITEANVMEMIESIPQKFLLVGAGSWYKMNNGYNPHTSKYPKVGGCATIAYMVSDYIFGDLPFTAYTSDAGKARAGDLVIFLDSSDQSRHFGIVVGNYWVDRIDRGRLDILNGVATGVNSWGGGGITEKDVVDHVLIYTRYPDYDSSFTAL